MRRFTAALILLFVLASSLSVQAVSAQTAPGVCVNKHVVPTVDGGSWEKRASTALFRSETAAAVLDGKIYIAGGLAGHTSFYTEITQSFAVYDPVADAWKDLAPMPEALHHVALANAHGAIYMTGGYSALDFVADRKTTWRYDPAADKWSPAADMPAPRAAHTMVTLNDVIYLVGGVTSASVQLWSYDPVADKWDTHHAPMPTAREHLASVVLDGKIYALGGETPNSNGTGNETYMKLATAEVYDPVADTWSTLPDMPTSRSSIVAAAINGKIHVVSGENVADNCVFPEHEVYDPVAKQWSAMIDMATPRHGAVAGVVDNRWYVINGGTKARLPDDYRAEQRGRSIYSASGQQLNPFNGRRKYA